MRAGREHAGGYKRGHKLSEEACRRIAAGCVGRVHPPRSAEHNAKLAAAKRGKKAGPQAEERRKKIAEAKGATLVRLRHTSGTEYDVVNRTEFMRQSGIRCREMLLRLLTGKIPEYRGYVVTHAG